MCQFPRLYPRYIYEVCLYKSLCFSDNNFFFHAEEMFVVVFSPCIRSVSNYKSFQQCINASSANLMFLLSIIHLWLVFVCCCCMVFFPLLLRNCQLYWQRCSKMCAKQKINSNKHYRAFFVQFKKIL
jgi:hypothetical protein